MHRLVTCRSLPAPVGRTDEPSGPQPWDTWLCPDARGARSMDEPERGCSNRAPADRRSEEADMLKLLVALVMAAHGIGHLIGVVGAWRPSGITSG